MAHSETLDYLRAERFMADAAKGRALASAFELGLIDCLAASGPMTFSALQAKLGCDEKGLRMLLHLLQANEAIEQRDDLIRLTSLFHAALRYRDYIEMKLSFSDFVLHDLGDHFTTLVSDPAAFHRRARLFSLFSYDGCLRDSAENREAARRWMRITTGLTRYEGPACLEHYDFSKHHRMLDIGGNSGEFARRACMRHPRLSAVVMDLPVVCRVGKEHLAETPEADRVQFLEGSALVDPIPGGFDLISFKSMLHDWPERETMRFLSRAVGALEPGGRVLIFERSPFESDNGDISFAALPFLLFFRSFRDSSWYESRFKALGLAEVATVTLRLDTPFHIITGRKQ
jgi:SAM-dependent methyltransferase